MLRITVQIRNVYGVETVYPACQRSMLLAQLAGTKTLTPGALRLIQALGYDIQVEAPSVRAAA